MYVLFIIIFFKEFKCFQSESLSQILKEVQEGKSVKFLTKAKKKIMHNVVEHSKSKRLQVC